MMWLNDHLPQVLVFLGLAILALEVIVFGLSTFVLFFVGLGALLTGLLMLIGILPETLISAFGSVGVISGLLAVALWKPLKNFQNDVDHNPVSSDLIGATFNLSENLSPDSVVSQSYSGISWRISADETIEAGTLVKVSQVEVGELKVERA
jgi:membrane protein implicated in regulation of membrane protease activity